MVVELAVAIERIVANQGGMDIFVCGIWTLFGQIRAVQTECAVTLERIVVEFAATIER